MQILTSIYFALIKVIFGKKLQNSSKFTNQNCCLNLPWWCNYVLFPRPLLLSQYFIKKINVFNTISISSENTESNLLIFIFYLTFILKIFVFHTFKLQQGSIGLLVLIWHYLGFKWFAGLEFKCLFAFFQKKRKNRYSFSNIYQQTDMADLSN